MGAIRKKIRCCKFESGEVGDVASVNIGGATRCCAAFLCDNSCAATGYCRLLCDANSLGRKLSRIDQPRTKEIVAKANFATMARDSLRTMDTLRRSEERRVGKEGRSRWSPDH